MLEQTNLNKVEALRSGDAFYCLELGYTVTSGRSNVTHLVPGKESWGLFTCPWLVCGRCAASNFLV